MIRYLAFVLFIVINSGCNFVNKNSSEIGDIPNTCLSQNTWEVLKSEYNISQIQDSTFLKGLKQMQTAISTVDILYFDENPKEIIGISKDHYTIRYGFNPDIHYRFFNGLTPDLSDFEQKRIHKRILNLLKPFYKCQEGMVQAKKNYKNRWDEDIW